MAVLSDDLLVVTILAYCLAMVCHAAEYAFGKRPARRGAAARDRDLVPAGTAPAAAPTPKRGAPLTAELEQGTPAQPGAPSGGPSWVPGTWLGRLSMFTLLVAAAAHLATAITRGLAAERLPWGNMYEFIVSTTLVAVAAWLVVMFRHPNLRHLGLYLALVNMALLGIAGMVVYTPVGPLVPALDSYWFVVHVSSATLATGIFLVGFVPAAMYLIRSGYDRGKRRFPYPLGRRLAGAEVLERLTFRLHAFAFPIWTFGALIAGPIWAEAAWGRYWNWDAKEIWAFISWIVYAAYLHARATPSVKRSTAAWLAIIGWLTMLVNLFGVNLFADGSLHSYA